MAFVYILHSDKLKRYYTGSTELRPEERLKIHLSKQYGNSKFTSAAEDWQLFHAFECNCISQAQSIEKHIKRMKSSVYVRNLKKYPEIVEKLKTQYS